jgi:hypothetical protein
MEDDILLFNEIEYGVVVNGELVSLFTFEEDAIDHCNTLSDQQKFHSVEVKQVEYINNYFAVKK